MIQEKKNFSGQYTKSIKQRKMANLKVDCQGFFLLLFLGHPVPVVERSIVTTVP